jgi:HEAT repeat protein
VLTDPDESVRFEAARILGRHREREAIPPIAEWLSGLDKATRVTAAEVLGEIGSRDAVGPLTRVLADSEAEVRRAAVEALGKIGGDAVEVAIVGRLDDDNMLVRRTAAEKLMELGDPRAVIPLLERFSDSAKEVRIAAMSAVGKLGDPRAVPALVRLLHDPMEEVRIAAAEALGNLRATRATDDLIPLLYRGADQFRVKVAYALGQIRDEKGIRELVRALGTDSLRVAAREALQAVGEAAVKPLVACLLGGIDACDAAAAVSVLKVVGDKRATAALVAELGRGRVKKELVIEALGQVADPQALLPLLALVDDPDADVRRQALDAVRPILDGRGAAVLIHLLDDKNAEVRKRAAEDLGVLKSSAAVPRLLALAAADPSAEVISISVWSLGEIGDARAIDPLVALLREGRGQSQRDAADALAKIRDPRSVPALVAVAKNQGASARREAVWALGGVLRGKRDDEVRKLLESLTLRSDPPLALAAIDALAAMRDPASVPGLVDVARNQSRELRRAALEVLGDFGDRQVTATLRAALGEEDDALRAAAAWALAKLEDPATRADLVRAAHDRGFATQVNGAAALARLASAQEPAAARSLEPELVTLASQRNGFVRANAALGLGALGASAGDPGRKAVAALLGDKDRRVRMAAARAAARLGGAEAQLRELAARDPVPEVRKAVAALLDGSAKPPGPRSDWVHLYTVDDAGQPVRHELYVLLTPDGLTKAGYTDARGELGEEQVVAGLADFEFVNHEEHRQEKP